MGNNSCPSCLENWYLDEFLFAILHCCLLEQLVGSSHLLQGQVPSLNLGISPALPVMCFPMLLNTVPSIFSIPSKFQHVHKLCGESYMKVCFPTG